MKINPDKRIGHVLFLVEGVKTEFQYLKAIFERILDYEYHQTKKQGEIRLSKPLDKNSSIMVLNTGGSYIASIEELDEETGEDLFFARLMERLEGTGFQLNRARIYYLFDRDPRSNVAAEKIDDYLTRFSDANDNGKNRAGLLLLSYPSVEAHLVSHFLPLEGCCSETGQQLKGQLDVWRREQGCKLSALSAETLLHATREFLAFFERELGYCFELDVRHHGSKLLAHQELFYQQSSQFKLFSQLVQALLDLGIISLDAAEGGASGQTTTSPFVWEGAC